MGGGKKEKEGRVEKKGEKGKEEGGREKMEGGGWKPRRHPIFFWKDRDFTLGFRKGRVRK